MGCVAQSCETSARPERTDHSHDPAQGKDIRDEESDLCSQGSWSISTSIGQREIRALEALRKQGWSTWLTGNLTILSCFGGFHSFDLWLEKLLCSFESF